MLKTIASGSALIAIWSGDITVYEADRAVMAAQQHRTQLGRPVVLIAVLAPDIKVPDAQVQARMKQQWSALVEQASTLQFVNLAKAGFLSSRIFAMITMVFGFAGGKVRAHKEVGPALDEVMAVDIFLKRAEIEAIIAREVAQK